MNVEGNLSKNGVAQCFESLPGRQGNPKVYVVRIGATQTYFYMNEAKSRATTKLINALNSKEISVVADIYENPRTVEFSAVASILPDPGKDGAYRDPQGQNALNEYATVITQIAENILKFPKIHAVSRELNLIVSHDAHSFHQDSFPRQYHFLENNPNFGRAQLIHDLTLCDWDMAPGTVSGTIYHDPSGGDRYLFVLLPKDQFATMTVEPVKYANDGTTPIDPGAGHLPFHAVLSPEDLYGGMSAGSSKGQRVSSVIRGLVQQNDFAELNSFAVELPLFRPVVSNVGDFLERSYFERGITITNEPLGRLDRCTLLNHSEVENVTVINIELTSGKNGFNLIKKDGGFNSLANLVNISDEANVMIYNQSVLPPGMKHYPIAEDQSDCGLPWMHLFHFPEKSWMKVKGSVFKRLSLTPLIELIFRDECSLAQHERKLKIKLQTNLLVIVE